MSEPDSRRRSSRRGAMGVGWALGILIVMVGIGFLTLRSEFVQTRFGG
jgi:hypothetical protein